MPKPKYLLVVNHIVSSVFKSVEILAAEPEFSGLEVLLITQNSQLAEKYSDFLRPSQVVLCDFFSSEEIGKALAAYTENIVGVICRGDKHIQYLRKVIPFLPSSVLVSSPKSLEISTNKALMRKAFSEKFPEITPKFINVYDSSDKTIQSIEAQVDYPVIIKPANLYSSLLIQTCDSRHKLSANIKSTLSQIKSIYEREGINEKPQIIVEEFLEGDLYSTDAFILGESDVYCSPLVGYIPAKKLGIDDFFLYKRFIPTELKEADEQAAFEVTAKALLAVGLKYSAAHIELIKTTKGWKIIELGPRLGRFRNIMYRLGYDIDLSLSDIKVHLGLKPELPNKLVNFCSAYSIYPLVEGKLKQIHGLEKLEASGLVKSLRTLAQPGDICLFAKNGGHALAEFVIASDDKEVFQKTVAFIEAEVYADID